jgi:hypothetical protein
VIYSIRGASEARLVRALAVHPEVEEQYVLPPALGARVDSFFFANCENMSCQNWDSCKKVTQSNANMLFINLTQVGAPDIRYGTGSEESKSNTAAIVLGVFFAVAFVVAVVVPEGLIHFVLRKACDKSAAASKCSPEALM